MLEAARRPSIHMVSRSTPIAAKPHRCMICDCEIQPGTKHNRWVYINYEDRDRRRKLHTVRYHVSCPADSNSNQY